MFNVPGFSSIIVCFSPVDYGDWFEYVLKMEAELNKSDYVMHLVYYEDLKEVMSYTQFVLKISSYTIHSIFCKSYLRFLYLKNKI